MRGVIDKTLRALHVALNSAPEGLQRQQRHFAWTIPTLRDQLLQALAYEYSTDVLLTLRDELSDFIESPTFDELEDNETEETQ